MIPHFGTHYPHEHTFIVNIFMLFFFILFHPFYMSVCAYSMHRLKKNEALNIINNFLPEAKHRDEHTYTPVHTSTHTRTLQRLFIDTHVYLVRYLESDSSVFSFLFAFSLNPYERNARRTSTPQETRQGEEKERERNG